jgi:hypothetical protein
LTVAFRLQKGSSPAGPGRFRPGEPAKAGVEPGLSLAREGQDTPAQLKIQSRLNGGSRVAKEVWSFNEDYCAFNDVGIWDFLRIRANNPPHSAQDAFGRISIGGCGEPSDEFVISAPPFLHSRRLAALAVSEPPAALPYGDHYREMAARLRELALLTRSPGIRRELVRSGEAIRPSRRSF